MTATRRDIRGSERKERGAQRHDRRSSGCGRVPSHGRARHSHARLLRIVLQEVVSEVLDGVRGPAGREGNGRGESVSVSAMTRQRLLPAAAASVPPPSGRCLAEGTSRSNRWKRPTPAAAEVANGRIQRALPAPPLSRQRRRLQFPRLLGRLLAQLQARPRAGAALGALAGAARGTGARRRTGPSRAGSCP